MKIGALISVINTLFHMNPYFLNLYKIDMMLEKIQDIDINWIATQITNIHIRFISHSQKLIIRKPFELLRLFKLIIYKNSSSLVLLMRWHSCTHCARVTETSFSGEWFYFKKVHTIKAASQPPSLPN